MMDETYRLVFRGEVLDGQHPAVVKKRLLDALKLSDDQAEKLFSGLAVVLKRRADTKTTARYQALFKKAGARLRLLPVEEGESAAGESPQRLDPEPAAAAQQSERTSTTPEPTQAANPTPGIQVLPAGSDVLRSDERPAIDSAAVNTDHLEVQYDEPNAEESPTTLVVNFPEFSIADLGAVMVDPSEPTVVDIDPQFDLAEVGAVIPTIPVDDTPAVDIASIRFDVAEVGADIGTPADLPDAVAPDISHLSLVAH